MILSYEAFEQLPYAKQRSFFFDGTADELRPVIAGIKRDQINKKLTHERLSLLPNGLFNANAPADILRYLALLGDTCSVTESISRLEVCCQHPNVTSALLNEFLDELDISDSEDRMAAHLSQIILSSPHLSSRTIDELLVKSGQYPNNNEQITVGLASNPQLTTAQIEALIHQSKLISTACVALKSQSALDDEQKAILSIRYPQANENYARGSAADTPALTKQAILRDELLALDDDERSLLLQVLSDTTG